MIRSNPFILRSVRFLVAAFICTLLVFSSAYPAAALGSSKSRLTDGEANLNQIQKKTDETVQNPPMTMEEVQKRNQGGLNEVQGAADARKMNNPENSQQATSVIDEVREALENLNN